jgi:hypothetical protein
MNRAIDLAAIALVTRGAEVIRGVVVLFPNHFALPNSPGPTSSHASGQGPLPGQRRNPQKESSNEK